MRPLSVPAPFSLAPLNLPLILPFRQDALFLSDLVSLFSHLNSCFPLDHSGHFSLHPGSGRFVLFFHCCLVSYFFDVDYRVNNGALVRKISDYHD